jgi:hypothetical protein
MWHTLGVAAAAALLVTSAIANAQPATPRFEWTGNGGRNTAAAVTTVFHGDYGSGTAVSAGGTTVFRGAPGFYAPPPASGPATAPPLPSGAGR